MLPPAFCEEVLRSPRARPAASATRSPRCRGRRRAHQMTHDADVRRDPARVDDRGEVEAGEERPGADPALAGEHVLAQRAGARERRDEAEQRAPPTRIAATARRPDGVVPAAISPRPALAAGDQADRRRRRPTTATSIAPTPFSSAGVADEHVVAEAADRAHARALAEVADDQADAERGRSRRSSPRHPPHREGRERRRRRRRRRARSAPRDVAVAGADDDPRRAAADEQRGAHHDRRRSTNWRTLPPRLIERELAVALRRRRTSRARRRPRSGAASARRPRSTKSFVPSMWLSDPVDEVAPVAGRAEAVGGRRRDREPLARRRRRARRRRSRRRSASAASRPNPCAQARADARARRRRGAGGHFAAQAVECWSPAPAAAASSSGAAGARRRSGRARRTRVRNRCFRSVFGTQPDALSASRSFSNRSPLPPIELDPFQGRRRPAKTGRVSRRAAVKEYPLPGLAEYVQCPAVSVTSVVCLPTKPEADERLGHVAAGEHEARLRILVGDHEPVATRRERRDRLAAGLQDERAGRAQRARRASP